MAGPAPLFREIHRLRRYSRDLQEQLDRIPRQLKAHQARVQKREADLHAEQELIRKLKLTASDREKSLKARHAQIARYEEQVNQVSSRKEYEALQQEIAHARTECSKLEDEGLEALSQVDEHTAALPALEKAVAEARGDLTKVEAQTKPRQADLEAQLRQAQEELRAVEGQIPGDLRPQYNRTIASMGADGMAAMKDRSCTACHTEVTVQIQWDLDAERFAVCSSCGRILYLPESTKRQPAEDE